MKSTLKLFLALGVMALNVGAMATTPKTPTFFARRDYPGLYSHYVQVADTNGDKIPDIIGGGFGSIKVLFGNGEGTFRPGPTTITAAPGAYSLTAADLNGDGKIDVVQANQNSIVVSMGNGDGTFQRGVNYPVNDTAIGYSVVGDFNGDHILDIATVGANNGVWLLTGRGDGTFNSAVLAASLSGSNDLAAADFNQDGKLDLVVTLTYANNDQGGGFVVLLGNGNGTFQVPQTFSLPQRAAAVAVGSLTKGGPVGIVVGPTISNNVYLYFGNGKGGFSGPKLVSLPGGPGGLAIGDANSDGIPDLVSESGYIAFGVGGGYFTKPISYPIEGAEQISNVVLADLRRNGQTDIITGGYAAISVLLNLGKGFLEDGIWTNVTGGAGCGVAADFNRDGKPDLAVDNANGVSILLGTGKYLAPFMAGTNIAFPGAACLVTGDLNGDGIPDLLVPVNGTSLAVNAYLGNGDGTFTLKSITPTPSGGYLALGDFNHDGKLDFVSSGNLIALGNGDGTFQNPANILPSSSGFSGITVGDINNDGWPDLVLTTSDFAVNTVLLNNQHGGFTQVPTNFGQYTAQPTLMDVNGDGHLDLVEEQTAGGEAAIYLGDGQGGFTFQVALAGPIPNISGTYCVADVNGDGILDVLVLGANTLNVYLGEGSATYAASLNIGTGSSPGSLLVENLHGQSPKVGIPDIVEPDSSGGVMVLLNLTK